MIPNFSLRLEIMESFEFLHKAFNRLTSTPLLKKQKMMAGGSLSHLLRRAKGEIATVDRRMR